MVLTIIMRALEETITSNGCCNPSVSNGVHCSNSGVELVVIDNTGALATYDLYETIHSFF